MKISVFGAGAWGTAFALYLTRLGHDVVLIVRRPELALDLQTKRLNSLYLPGIDLDDRLKIISSQDQFPEDLDLLVLACPTKGLAACCQHLATKQSGHALAVLTLCKGMDPQTLDLPTACVATYWPGIPAGVLSGPNHAGQVAQGLPSAATIAFDAPYLSVAHQLQAALNSSLFRIYTSTDRAGVELGGALKNIYAIAGGVVQGLKLGDNTKAALLTRALKEMAQIGVALGGQTHTFYGLSGLGDLMATAYGPWSRNRQFGERLGQGERVDDILASCAGVVEGYSAIACLNEKIKHLKLDTPILNTLYAIIFGQLSPEDAMQRLMNRPHTIETLLG